MSQENVEIVRQAFTAFTERGFAGLRGYLAPDFEVHEDPKFPESGISRGFEAFEAYAEQFFAAWDAQDWRLEEAIPVGAETVLTNFRIKWRGGGSGAEVETTPGWVWTVRDGKAIRCRAFLERHEARQVAGLQG